jgi:hypothetical protein
VKGQVTIAYWDSEQRSRMPPLLGEIKGTPTIRLYKPKKKQSKKGSHAEKAVMDYNGEREMKPMRGFVEDNMPSNVERITFASDFEKTKDKSTKYGLPMAILFTSKAKTSAVTKWLSTEFRRRLLLLQVPPTKTNQALLKEYGLTTEDLPALIVVSPSGEQVRYSGEGFSRRHLEGFLKEHALQEPVYKPIVVEEEAASQEDPTSTTTNEGESTKSEEATEEEPKQKVHVEL